MAEWKKVLVQDADITVNTITLGSTAVTSTAEELNLLDGVSGLVQGDFTKLAAVDSTAAELNLVDGSSAGTVVNSKAVIYGSAGEVNATKLQVGGADITSTPAELNLLDGVSGLVQADFTKLAAIDATAAEIDVLDGVTAGTAAASKAVVLDANKDIGTIRDISGSGALFSGTVTANAFSGDGSGLTGVAAGSIDIDNFTELAATPHATQDEFLVSDNGTEKRVSMTNVANGAFALVSGDATIAAGGALTIAANSVEGTMLNTNVADTSTLELSSDTLSVLKVPNALTDGNGFADFSFDGSSAVSLSVGAGTGITVNASDVAVTAAQTGITSLINSSLTKIGTAANQEYVDFSTANEVNVKINDTERLSVTATGVDITGAATVSTNLTVSGNLTVAGTTTEVQTANLNVEDKFILLNSGSSTATDESGIIFGGSGGTALTGSALIWNGDYNSNDGRAAIAHTVAGSDTSATVAYHLAGVFAGSTSDAATAKADHVGNIRVESSEIYIYV